MVQGFGCLVSGFCFPSFSHSPFLLCRCPGAAQDFFVGFRSVDLAVIWHCAASRCVRRVAVSGLQPGHKEGIGRKRIIRSSSFRVNRILFQPSVGAEKVIGFCLDTLPPVVLDGSVPPMSTLLLPAAFPCLGSFQGDTKWFIGPCWVIA
ncbi:hypothetical protein GE21DRAFT_1074982 [Neurospora crassa]|nr:hypothetical protein GE21DRAFT_1074982 [Neurospora crassa]